MRKLAASGVGIVYISHRLEEVPHDRRPGDGHARRARGRYHRAARAAGRTRRLLVGRPLDELFPARAQSDRPRRSCICVTPPSAVSRESAGWQAPTGVSLDVHEGEIVGLAGVMGAGRTELLSAALRHRPAPAHWQGDVEVDGQPVKLDSIKAARQRRHRLRHRRPARQRPDAAAWRSAATSSCR